MSMYMDMYVRMCTSVCLVAQRRYHWHRRASPDALEDGGSELQKKKKPAKRRGKKTKKKKGSPRRAHSHTSHMTHA